MPSAGARSTTAERRRAILEAALECFTTLGFAATTLEDIRSRSRASTGSIYHHFSSKEELAGSLYVEGLRDYQEGLLEELRRHRSAERGIRAIVEHHLRWVAAHPDWARYLLHTRQAELVAATEPEIRDMNRLFFREVSAWMKPHVDGGRLRRLPEDLYTAVLVGPSQEFARHWLAGRARSDIARARRVLGDVAWNSLRTKG